MLLFTLLLTLVHCSGQKMDQIDKYFDVQQYIDQQVAQLHASSPKLTKTLQFGDSTESKTFTDLDSAGWNNELKIFREHDINKPVLVDAYQIKQIPGMQGENMETYELKDDSQNGVCLLYTSDAADD